MAMCPILKEGRELANCMDGVELSKWKRVKEDTESQLNKLCFEKRIVQQRQQYERETAEKDRINIVQYMLTTEQITTQYKQS